MKLATLIYLTLISVGYLQNTNASLISDKSTAGTPFPRAIRELKFNEDNSRKEVKYTDFSAKNNLLVSVSQDPCEDVCGEQRHQVNVYDLNSGSEVLRPMVTFRHFTPDNFIPYLDDWRNSWKPIISSDEKFIVTRPDDGVVMVSSLVKDSGFRRQRFEMPEPIKYSATSASLSDDNKRLAIGFERYDEEKRRTYGFIKVFDMDSGLPIAEFTNGGVNANSLYFSPDGTFLTASYAGGFCNGWNATIKVYNIQSKKPLNILMPNGCTPSSDFFSKYMFSEDSKTISIFHGLSTTKVDLTSENILSTTDEAKDFIWDSTIQLSPDRRFKIVKKNFGSRSNQFAVYDLQSKSQTPTMYFWEESSSYMTNKKYYASGNQLVLPAQHLGADPYFTEIYDMSTGRQTAKIKSIVAREPLQLVSGDGRYAIIANSLWQLY